MSAFSIPMYGARRDVYHYGPRIARRMADYSYHAPPSRKPATLASTERLLAACTCRDKDPVIMRNFQDLLLVTVTDWQRCDVANGKRG